jgi:xanthosine utilization system XapX-like protein
MKRILILAVLASVIIIGITIGTHAVSTQEQIITQRAVALDLIK